MSCIFSADLGVEYSCAESRITNLVLCILCIREEKAAPVVKKDKFLFFIFLSSKENLFCEISSRSSVSEVKSLRAKNNFICPHAVVGFQGAKAQLGIRFPQLNGLLRLQH